MATRFKLQHQDDIRAKIQTERLVAYLQAGIFGEQYQKRDITLTAEKISAIRVLLAKTLPDLSAIQHSGGLTMTHEQQLERLK